MFLGPLLDRLEPHESDFVVEGAGGGPIPGREDWMACDYFRPEALRALDPGFAFPGFTFNTGALLGTSAILTRADFDPWVRWEHRPRAIHPDVFGGVEQGVLNYVLMRKAQQGELSLERVDHLLWALRALRQISWERAGGRLPAPHTDPATLAHWAGKKHPIFWPMPNARLLGHFDALYHTRVPGGGRLQVARACRALGTFAWHSARRRLPGAAG